MRQRNTRARGFSLIELMIAMTVTLIVTGAIYGLMTGGQQAFRREPAMSDRQQNARLAMDIIMRDVASAGTGMPSFMQTFTPGLNGESLGACVDREMTAVPCPIGPSGALTDELEIMANPGGNMAETACGYEDTGASQGNLAAATTNLEEGDVVMVLLYDNKWTMRAITDDPGTNSSQRGSNPGCAACATSQCHSNVSWNTGGDTTGYNQSGGICTGNPTPGAPPDCSSCVTNQGKVLAGNACCSVQVEEPDGDVFPRCTVVGVLQSELVRYRIRLEDGVPNLERWSSGRMANFDAGGNRLYQVIARGIDDLQIVYADANGNEFDDAPQVDLSQADYGSLTRNVRITLSARSEEVNIAGAKRVAAGPDALRGQLTVTVTPRAVLATLGTPVADRQPWVGPSPSPEPWF